jgi:hypothetical protein
VEEEMRVLQKVLATIVLCTFIVPATGVAQTSNDAGVWRAFVEKVPIGAELNVRLRNGQRFRATIVQVSDQAVMVLPKTRQPVPVQSVAYDDIASLERREHGGISGGKAAAIGVASGVGGFFGAMLILLALIGD